MSIRELSENELEEIELCLILDEDQLYSLIPTYLPQYENTLFSTKGQTEAGKREFQSIQQALHQRVCQEWNLCEKIDDPVLADNINLVVTIADLISPIIIGFPPFVVASILVKIGLRSFCNCQHSKI